MTTPSINPAEATPHSQLVVGEVYRIYTTTGRTGLVRILNIAGELSYQVLSNGRIEAIRTEPEGTLFVAEKPQNTQNTQNQEAILNSDSSLLTESGSAAMRTKAELRSLRDPKRSKHIVPTTRVRLNASPRVNESHGSVMPSSAKEKTSSTRSTNS